MAVVDVDNSSWDEKVIRSSIPVIVDFWAPWCPWCRKLAPVFESLSSKYSGRLVFAKVNVEESPALAERYGVEGLPTLKLICSGRPTAEMVGYLPEDALRKQIDQMLAMYKECLEHSSVLRRVVRTQ